MFFFHAQIPNPLFDLAGITCGHFLVPFWTFFGATVIGKAVVKMHIQKVFVIIAFNETLIDKALDLLAFVPVLGPKAQEPFRTFLKNQKARLHQTPGQSEKTNFLAKLFEYFVFAMIVYFLFTILNSLAQSYHSRDHNRKSKSKSKKKSK